MEPRSAVRRGAVAVVVVAALLGLSGCFRASQDVKVRGDGSGSVVLHAEVDKRALADVARSLGGLGALGVPPVSLTGTTFRAVDRTFADGTKVRAVDNPDRATLDASFDFSGPNEYRRKIQQVSAAVSANPDASLTDDGSIQIRLGGNRIEVALDLGASVDLVAPDLSALAAVLGRDAMPKVVVTITMPGPILASNGSAKGRTVTWDLLSPDAPRLLTAASTVARPGLPSWAVPAGAGLVLVLLLAAVGVLLSRRRLAAERQVPDDRWQPSPGAGTFFPPAPDLPPAAGAGWPTPPPAAPPAPPPPAEPLPWPVPGPPPDEVVPAAPVPGWYADPAGGPGLRWWDGRQWTPHTR